MMNREEALQWLSDKLKEWPMYQQIECGDLPNIKETGCSWVVTWEEVWDGLQKQATIRIGETPTFGKIDDELRITKKDWLAAKQPEDEVMSEWIKNENGGCPVRGDVEIEVKLKDGSTSSGAAENYLWSIVDDMGDIKEYRIIKDTTPLTRDEALAWLADNVKAWPWSKQVLPEIDNPHGWEWVATGGQWKQLICLNGLITHDDWHCTKQPDQSAPTSNDEDWVDSDGKNYPIGSETVEVKLNNGIILTGIAANFSWKFGRSSGDIKQYRLISDIPSSNKPSWDDAPEDAKILVQSENGKFNFGSFPNAVVDSMGGDDIEGWEGQGVGKWFPSIQCAPNPNWHDTLEHRPVVKESLTVQDKQDAVLQYVPKNLARIKQLNDEIEMAKFSIETMQIELAERTKEVQDVLNYCKFNA